jgi:hypothetical protein
MPCVYDDYGESDRKAKEELDKLTRMLCATCRQVEDCDLKIEDRETKAWWTQHKKADAERRRLEQLAIDERARRQAALLKLTVEERRLLGL